MYLTGGCLPGTLIKFSGPQNGFRRGHRALFRCEAEREHIRGLLRNYSVIYERGRNQWRNQFEVKFPVNLK